MKQMIPPKPNLHTLHLFASRLYWKFSFAMSADKGNMRCMRACVRVCIRVCVCVCPCVFVFLSGNGIASPLVTLF